MLNTKNVAVRSALTIYLAPLVVAIFVGNQFYSSAKSIATLEKNLDVLAEQVAKRLSTSLDKPLWDMDEKAVLVSLESEMGQQDLAGIIVKTGQNNSSILGRGRDASWKIIEAKSVDDPSAIQRQKEITHENKTVGKVTVYCTHRFIDAERNSMILTTVVTSIVMAVAVALAIFLLLSGILRRTVNALSAEAKRIQVAVQEGRLSERADPAAVGPEFRDVLAGTNLIIEALVTPLRHNMRFVLEMADGKVPPRDETAAHGEFEQSRKASNLLVDTVHLRNADADMLIQAALDGRLSVRADTSKYSGYNSKLVERMNDMIDAVAKPLGVAVRYVELIAKGEIPERIRDEWKGDFNSLRTSLNQCIDALSGLLSGMAQMAKEHAAGELDAAVDEKRFLGAYRDLATGVNTGIRMYVDLLRNIQAILVAYADGNFEPVLRRLPGKQEQLNETLDKLRGNLRSFSAEVQALSSNAVAGKLSARADLTRYAGDWRKLVEGVNATMDAVIAPLKTAGDTVDRIAKGDIPSKLSAGWKGDYAVLEANLNTCIDSLNGLIAQMTTMTRAQTSGDYDAYMPEDRFVGVYRELAAGVNSGVRMLVQTIQKILNVLASYADGDFNPVLEKLPGKQVIANQRLDLLRRNLLLVASEIRELSEAAVQGRLSARADPSKFKGDWASLAKGLNATLESILAPVHETSQVLEKLASRDLRARVTANYQGDHAALSASVNGTASALHEAMVKVAESADQVSAASSQVASSSQSVANGASEQASSIEETSASLESMASMIKQAADNAHQANTLAQSAKGAATEGTAAMEQMQGAMGKIRASAESTSEIIKDINEIAFQTNLLALNAAVEAARAGEAGRGFAVVAEEVRSLALRSKEAANRTEALIRQSVKEAEEGGNTTKHVNDKLGEIAVSITKVSDIVAEIAAAAKEQAAGIEQATRAVAEVDKVTQQNAASSEESNSAAQELSSQADNLAAMVRTFELVREQTPALGPVRGAAKLALPATKGKAPAPATKPRKPMRPAQAAPAGAERKQLKPEDIIPLDDDREFQDF